MQESKLKKLLQDIISLPEYAGFAEIDVNSRSHFGDYPIHTAAFWGNLDAVKLLVENGADVNAIGEREQTPLFSALINDSIEVISYLVSQGARMDARDADGRTVLNVAHLLSEHVETAMYLEYLVSEIRKQ